MHMKGYVFVLMAACLWALIGPVSRYAFREGLAPIEVALWRAVIGWAVFAAHAAAIGRMRVEPRDLPVLAVFGLIGVSLFYLSYQLAVQAGGAALASVLLYTAPAWVALLSFLVLKESMGRTTILAVLLTLAGVIMVSLGPDTLGRGGQASLWAIVCGLTSGFTYALYFIFGKLYLHRYPAPTIFLYALPVGAAGLLPFAEIRVLTPTAWLCVGILALCCTYMAYSIYYAGLKRIEATRAAVVATLEPVLAALLAFWWWDERFGPAGYAGSTLILAAVLLAILDGRRESRPMKPGGRITSA